MMNKKSQIYAVREIFQFGLGIVLLTSVFYIFYNNIIPLVADYALQLEAENINSHINYLASSIINIAGEGMVNSTIVSEYELPYTISDYSYSSYFSGNNLCTIINELGVNQCFEMTNQDINYAGVFFSGGTLTLRLVKDNNQINLIMTN